MQQSRCWLTKKSEKKKSKLKSLPQRKPILTDWQRNENQIKSKFEICESRYLGTRM